jgi:nicotinamidase-related amidase
VSSKTTLLLIDVQVNMLQDAFPVEGSGPLLERLRRLLRSARDAGAPVIFVRNSGGAGDPDERGTPGWELHPALQPAEGDVVLDKTTANTFASTNLAQELSARGITRLVIAGVQSELCIRETALGALALGYPVTLVLDGHSTYDGKDRKASAISAAVNEELFTRTTLIPAREVSFSSATSYSAPADASGS